MSDWAWNGARWWKFDFHTHTPASLDFGKGRDQASLKQVTPEEWLLAYMRAGIDCVAVTDHNSGDWVDSLKMAYSQLKANGHPDFQDLVLFPGMEISVNGGVHLLAIFGPEATTSTIDTVRGAVGCQEPKGSCDMVTTVSFSQVVEEVAKAGGLAIPAHVDGPCGLFVSQKGQTLAQSLKSILHAIELLDVGYEKPQLSIDAKTSFAEVLGSDSHHLAGPAGARYPGSHFTWVKMSRPTLEGLRLALLDGELSLLRSDRQDADPNQHSGLVIQGIEINQAKYIGRSGPFRLMLNPWLNAIIGGRGTGKSTLVELLRTALRREEELPGSLNDDFSKYHRVCADRDDDGLLTDQAHLAVSYQKDGTTFRVQWNQAEDVEAIEVQDEGGEWVAQPGDVAQRFPVRIYSQKHIFELAKAPLALLKIVDDAPAVDRRSWDDRWGKEESRFLSLRAKAREIEAGLADEARLQGELADIKRRLGVFEAAGHAVILKEYQRRLLQQRALDDWQESWSALGDQLRSSAATINCEEFDLRQFDTGASADADILQRVDSVREKLSAARKAAEEIAKSVDDLQRVWDVQRASSSWKAASDAAVKAYEDLREQLAAEGAGAPTLYGELVQRRQVLEGKLKEIEARKKQLAATRQEGDQSASRLLVIRRELTRARTKFLEDIIGANPFVRVAVEPYGARELVEEELRSLIRREDGRFEKEIGSVDPSSGLLGQIYQGAAGAGSIETRLDGMKRILVAMMMGQEEQKCDRRFREHLAKLQPEDLDRLEIWFPEDSLNVQYSTGSVGAEFRPIQGGSPGQKTAALLAFLLSYGTEPIILDQPEDDLDNHLIYDLVVKQLREIKRRRQVIVVTHNANIVVNGDAELVVALEVRQGETRCELQGSLQERAVRQTICTVVEGGRDALEQRYRRIALEVRPS